MAVVIDWGLIVGNKTVDDGGYVGDLMNLAKVHIDKSVTDNRITKAQAGEVYVTMISAAITGGINFGIEKQLKETQITGSLIDNELSVIKAQLGAWTAIFNSGKYDDIPEMVGKSDIDAAYDVLKAL